jgi:kinetochore protein Spc7/SPC105
MKDDIRESQAQLDATETDCSVHNPPVIREYLSATDEDKQLFEMTFKAFKANTQLKARERWYDWKMGLMQRVGPDVEEMLKGMQEVGRFGRDTGLARANALSGADDITTG